MVRIKHWFDISAFMAFGMLCQRFRGAQHHDLAPLIDAIKTEINNQVGSADHIEVVSALAVEVRPGY